MIIDIEDILKIKDQMCANDINKDKFKNLQTFIDVHVDNLYQNNFLSDALHRIAFASFDDESIKSIKKITAKDILTLTLI